MRTRSRTQSSGKDDKVKKVLRKSETETELETLDENGSHEDVWREDVKKVPRNANARVSSQKQKQKQEYNIQSFDSINTSPSEPKRIEKQAVRKSANLKSSEAGCSKNAEVVMSSDDEMDDSVWEECHIPKSESQVSIAEDGSKGLTIEFDKLPDSGSQKPARRVSAEEKEMAELVHKVHLLCLLTRGRIVDNACEDPLIQAALLSLLPSYLLKISELSRPTVRAVSPLISWFHGVFRIRNSPSAERSFRSALAVALESREGTPEELAALSVALLRALNLTTRYVAILDVASKKPGADEFRSIGQDKSKLNRQIFNTSTPMVAIKEEVSASPVKPFLPNRKQNVSKSSLRRSSKRKECSTSNVDASVSLDLKHTNLDSLDSKAENENPEACSKDSKGPTRKGDLEFEMQLEMALTATAVESSKQDRDSPDSSSPCKKLKRIQGAADASTSSQGISTAVGSTKVGSPLFWAEVYCYQESMEGKWVHFDAVNATIDGEKKVEATAAACRTSLRYVVAFAGGGAKDVTRRYCSKWHKIAPKRVNPQWWDSVMAPLRQLELASTGGTVQLGKDAVGTSDKHDKAEASTTSNYSTRDASVNQPNTSINVETSAGSSFIATRSSLEDMELETRALTEPLPTNQQAYKSHELYALERWLNQNQMLHPKGPILGFCSGHPVYPRTCVQTLRTKERWLREGLQVKANELPAKVRKCSSKLKKTEVSEAGDNGEDDAQGTSELYGKWQLEPLCLPHAVNGIVPKNDRGQVDVWSEKCLPPGTVHLRFPRIFTVAKRLGIDYAPAMVGFEFRNRSATPVFDGIVVCAEFRDVILEAYQEEVERREAKEKKWNEKQALSRWYQLLSSIVTRQKLKNRYGDGSSSHKSTDLPTKNDHPNQPEDHSKDKKSLSQDQQLKSQKERRGKRKSKMLNKLATEAEDYEHEHVFLINDQTYDEETSVRTKRCHCGFLVQVEEL